MKRVAALLLLVAVAACQETVTSPESRVAPSNTADRAFVFSPTNPPPPPNDTASFTSGGGEFATVNVTYFLNRTQTNGFLTFRSQTDAGVIATPDARVSYHRGVFTGTGTLTIRSGFIDLSSVTQASHFGNSDQGYFEVTYDRSYKVVGNDTSFAGPAYSRIASCRLQATNDGCFVEGGLK
jgi:hypothetical protein